MVTLKPIPNEARYNYFAQKELFTRIMMYQSNPKDQISSLSWNVV